MNINLKIFNSKGSKKSDSMQTEPTDNPIKNTSMPMMQ